MATKKEIVKKLKAAGIEFDQDATAEDLEELLPAEEEQDEDEEEAEEEPEVKSSRPIVEGDEIYVNRDKYNRAKVIVALCTGKKVPATEQERERKEFMGGRFAEAEVDPKGKGAFRFAYETLLGGLVRSPKEQAAADKAAAKQTAKFKKKKIDN